MADIVPPPNFNIQVIRENHTVSREARQQVLRAVGYNVFAFPAELVTVDYLSDSGTSAMTDLQWSAMFRGDESYGRNTGYYYLLDTFRDIFERGENRLNTFQRTVLESPKLDDFLGSFLDLQEGGFVNGGAAQMARPNCFLVPQGRCAEALLFQATAKCLATQSDSSPVIISNGFFDTTKANAEAAGFKLQTFVQGDVMHASQPPRWKTHNDFNGNLDVDATRAFLKGLGDKKNVTMIILTLTNNWAAGQPVSLANIRATSNLLQEHNIPLFFDACRFAENAMFIKKFEDGYQNHSIAQIIHEMFSYADGFTISLKKDGLANIGGALFLRDRGKYTTAYPGVGTMIREQQILRYGNDSYGGMSGRDLMAATAGLYEGTKESYLMTRLNQAQSFAEKMSDAGLPVILPPGASAVFLDMDGFFEDCKRSYQDFAGLGFTLELLEKYGVRSFESGPFAWQWDRQSEEKRKATPNLVRFAIPRQRLTDQHLDYTVAAVRALRGERKRIQGVRIVEGKESSLRHFQCALEPVQIKSSA